MNKKDVELFFDHCASWWDDDMVRNDEIINKIWDNSKVKENTSVLDQTCPIMIQRLRTIFQRNPLISMGI